MWTIGVKEVMKIKDEKNVGGGAAEKNGNERTFTREFKTVVPAMVKDIITIRLVKKAKTQKTM